MKVNRVIDFGDGKRRVPAKILEACQLLERNLENISEFIIRHAWKAKSLRAEDSGEGEDSGGGRAFRVKKYLLSWLDVKRCWELGNAY